MGTYIKHSRILLVDLLVYLEVEWYLKFDACGEEEQKVASYYQFCS